MEELITAIKENNLLKVKVALKKGDIDLNSFVEIGEDEEVTLLFYAIRERVNLDIIKLLLDAGADIDYVDESGVGVLDKAVIYGNKDLINYLVLERGFDINTTKRKSGLSPFIQSCCYGDVDLAKYMYELGADASYRDKLGMSALDYAKRLGHKRMQSFLEELEEKKG